MFLGKHSQQTRILYLQHSGEPKEWACSGPPNDQTRSQNFPKGGRGGGDLQLFIEWTIINPYSSVVQYLFLYIFGYYPILFERSYLSKLIPFGWVFH